MQAGNGVYTSKFKDHNNNYGWGVILSSGC